MTVREDINQVRKLLNSTLDTRVSNQFVYNKIIDVAKLIIKREADTRRIFRSTELFRTLDCVELSQEELTCFLPNCKSVMKSVIKLPKTFLANSGSMLMVYSVDRSVQFVQTSPSIYTNIAKREFKGNQKYFWIQDDYLYIPDSYISAVIIDGLFIDNSKLDNSCTILNSTSSLPDWIRTDVFRVVASEIGQIMKRIPKDESTELNSNKLN